MEKNFVHPLCACGQPVIVHEWAVPCYDDGGSLDSVDYEYEFDDVCGKCYIKRETQFVSQLKSDEDIDDLPF